MRKYTLIVGYHPGHDEPEEKIAILLFESSNAIDALKEVSSRSQLLIQQVEVHSKSCIRNFRQKNESFYEWSIENECEIELFFGSIAEKGLTLDLGGGMQPGLGDLDVELQEIVQSMPELVSLFIVPDLQSSRSL